MPEQYGFYYDAGRCIQCRTCEVACKNTRDVEPGVKLRRVIETWDGSYPDVTVAFFSLACMHCEKPACASFCPTGAIYKRSEDGIVVVDKDKCNGCRDCLEACPYSVPQFGADGILQKCDFCIETDKEPACTISCPVGALSFGTIDTPVQSVAGKTAVKMEGATGPSVILLG